MSRVKFNPEINLGHLIQLAAGIIVLISAYSVLNYRIAIQETVNDKQTQAIEKLISITERIDERTRNVR